MKRVIGMVMFVLMLSFVLSQQGVGMNSENINGIVKAKAGEYVGAAQEKIQVREHMDEIELEVEGIKAKCECNLTQEKVQNRTRFRVQMENGEKKEVRIMPNVASEKAIERLKLKVCSEENNCTLELKEVGNEKVAYEVKAKKSAKIFGLFKSSMEVETQIDAETGEVIKTKKPWWAFLASESDS